VAVELFGKAAVPDLIRQRLVDGNRVDGDATATDVDRDAAGERVDAGLEGRVHGEARSRSHASTDEKFTMRPHPRSRIPGKNAWVARNTWRRLAR
jgi:hypothetical protein